MEWCHKSNILCLAFTCHLQTIHGTWHLPYLQKFHLKIYEHSSSGGATSPLCSLDVWEIMCNIATQPHVLKSPLASLRTAERKFRTLAFVKKRYAKICFLVLVLVSSSLPACDRTDIHGLNRAGSIENLSFWSSLWWKGARTSLAKYLSTFGLWWKGVVGVLLAGGISWPPFTIFAAVIISASGHSSTSQKYPRCTMGGAHEWPGYLCRAESRRALAYLGGNQMSAVATT